MSSFTRKGDFWAGLVMAALGVFVVTQAYDWDYMTEDGPGAGFFPLWYGAVMVVLSLLLVAGAVLKEGAKAKAVTPARATAGFCAKRTGLDRQLGPARRACFDTCGSRFAMGQPLSVGGQEAPVVYIFALPLVHTLGA